MTLRALLFLCSWTAICEQVKVSVAPFLNDKKGAITYTFDDGLRSQFTEALPVLNSLGIKATFFVVPGLTPDNPEEAKKKAPGAWGGISWSELKTIADQGHEIGNHSLHHKNLVSLKDEEIHHQIDEAQKLIHEKLGIHAHSFCCPYNSTNEKVSKIIDAKLPFRRKHLCGFGSKISKEAMNSRVDQSIDKGLWDVIMIHGISVGYDKFEDPQGFFDHLKYAKSRENKIWIDTFASIASYMHLAKSAKIDYDLGENSLTCHLSSEKTHVPGTLITLRIHGLKSQSVKAYQGEKKLELIHSDSSMLINVEPNHEAVKIYWEQ